MLKIDGYNDSIIGQTCCWDGNTKVDRLIYDGQRLIAAMTNQGMTDTEALEYIEFNIEGAYVGQDTPMIMWPYEEDV